MIVAGALSVYAVAMAWTSRRNRNGAPRLGAGVRAVQPRLRRARGKGQGGELGRARTWLRAGVGVVSDATLRSPQHGAVMT